LIIVDDQNRNTDSALLWRLNAAFLHIGKLSIPASLSESFRSCIAGTGCQYCLNATIGSIGRLILSVRVHGDYSFPAWMGSIPGHLVTADGRPSMQIQTNYSFIDSLSFVPSANLSLEPSTPLNDTIAAGVAAMSGVFEKSFIKSDSSPVLKQAPGGTVVRITLVAIFSFLFLAAVGVIIIVMFRRRAKSIAETMPSDSVDLSETVIE
jgi:hypothetical protein